MIVPFLFLVAGCVPVRELVLRASDLARAEPLFQSADPAAQIGYAPVPGSRRVVSKSEAVRFARRFGIEGDPREVCFEWAMNKLSAEPVVEAIRKVLPKAEVSVLDLPLFDVPDGPLRFSLASLPTAASSRTDDSVIWRGSVEYAPGRNFAIWAKVRLVAVGTRAELLHNMAAGDTIFPGDIELREFRIFPGSAKWIATTEEVAGRKLLSGVKEGNGITLAALAPVGQAIERGDEVTVQVQSGGALIKVSARAESAAGLGQTVRLRNTKSGKVFEGTVTGKRMASVTASESEENR